MGNDLPDLARPPGTLPQAQREQRDIQPWEAGLVELARIHHPTVKWWQGYRRASERFGSYCYLCEKFIVTWDRFAGIPQLAVDRIHSHKYDHRNGILAAPAPITKERAPQ